MLVDAVGKRIETIGYQAKIQCELGCRTQTTPTDALEAFRNCEPRVEWKALLDICVTEDGSASVCNARWSAQLGASRRAPGGKAPRPTRAVSQTRRRRRAPCARQRGLAWLEQLRRSDLAPRRL